MSGYDVVIEELRSSARAAESAARVVRGVRLDTAVQPIATGMPGSRSASAAPGLGGAWQQELTTWSDDATAYGRRLTEAADSYERSDTEAAANIQAAGAGVGAGGMRPLW